MAKKFKRSAKKLYIASQEQIKQQKVAAQKKEYNIKLERLFKKSVKNINIFSETLGNIATNIKFAYSIDELSQYYQFPKKQPYEFKTGPRGYVKSFFTINYSLFKDQFPEYTKEEFIKYATNETIANLGKYTGTYINGELEQITTVEQAISAEIGKRGYYSKHIVSIFNIIRALKSFELYDTFLSLIKSNKPEIGRFVRISAKQYLYNTTEDVEYNVQLDFTNSPETIIIKKINKKQTPDVGNTAS